MPRVISFSISGFAANTDNFFAVSDAQIEPGPDGRKGLDVVLASREAKDLPEGARVIRAPTSRGLILFRSLVTDDAALARLRELQVQQRCEPLAEK